MSKYTKRQAILDCHEMWSELAKSGSADKLETWFFKYTQIHCAFCEYTSGTKDCLNCPAYGKWGNGALNCMSTNSYFLRWGCGNIEISANPSIHSRRYWARQIVKLCDMLLAELDAEEGK